MKQLLITLVAVLLGSTAISSYAKDNHKARVSDNPVNVLIEGSKAVTADEPNSEVSDEGKKNTNYWLDAEEPSEVGHPRKCREKHDCPYLPPY
jgi:hypothetical protein